MYLSGDLLGKTEKIGGILAIFNWKWPRPFPVEKPVVFHTFSVVRLTSGKHLFSVTEGGERLIRKLAKMNWN